MDLTAVQKRILFYCVDDETQMYLVIDEVLDEHLHNNDDYILNKKKLPLWVQEEVLGNLREMLDDDLIIIGEYEFSMARGWSFIQFEGSTDEVLAKVKYEWDILGKNPSGGDVCWIRSTDKGNQVAKDLGLDKKWQ